MSLGSEGLGGILPEQAMVTAVAMAERTARMQVLTERIGAEIQGVPYVESPLEVRRAALLGRSTLMLARIENPDGVITLQEVVEAGRGGNAGYTHRAESLAERGTPIDAGEVRSVERAILNKLLTDSGVSDDREAQAFAKQLAASKRVAKAHGVELATVYTNDDLYYEAAREAEPLEEAAEHGRRLIDAVSTDMMNMGALQLMTDEELAEMGLETQTMFAAATSTMQEVVRQVFLYDFIRTYGYDAINRLSAEHRESLLPKMPLATDLAALVNSNSGE